MNREFETVPDLLPLPQTTLRRSPALYLFTAAAATAKSTRWVNPPHMKMWRPAFEPFSCRCSACTTPPREPPSTWMPTFMPILTSAGTAVVNHAHATACLLSLFFLPPCEPCSGRPKAEPFCYPRCIPGMSCLGIPQAPHLHKRVVLVLYLLDHIADLSEPNCKIASTSQCKS